ncbi:MAG TPA: response regulator transcription factor, partial [Acidimicrobiia bacterium]|nr:response regulator transcription factor [Acidimicrobiia bacterium]
VWKVPACDGRRPAAAPAPTAQRRLARLRSMTPDPAPGVVAGIMDVMAGSVLAVEDDDGIRTTMRMALEDEGFEVTEAASGEAALEAFDRQPTDLVLVDLMLPGMNGFDLCRALRSASDVPIVVVTARVDSHDVVAGLEAGADDYVRKPFAVKELAARIRALLRRSQRDGEASGVPPDVYRFEAIEVVPDAGVVRRGGEELRVTKTEFRLLCELAVNRGLVLSREQLLERVWGYDYFGDQRLVDSHIRRLRMKIEDDPSDPRLLVTVRGLGYKLGQ